jgi:glutaminase
MKSPVPDYLWEILGTVRTRDSGERADYIPTLAEAEPGYLAAAFATVDGQVYEAGDTSVEFSIQSISKPFAYALALSSHGSRHVLEKVGVEPSGEAFNEMSLDADGRPLNPMINAGAVTVHSLIGDAALTTADRDEMVVAGLSAFAGRVLRVDEQLVSDELGSAHRNLGIGYMLRSHGILEEDPAEVVKGYIRQCSVMVTVTDLAVMAATLANNGTNPVTGENVVSAGVVRQVLSVMATCGMYDAAGDWFTQVGIPAKSGVAGGIIGALPGQLGIATFSPRLDKHGNSARGVQLFERFSVDMGLHLMEVPAPSRSVLGGMRVFGDGDSAVRVIGLQGSLRFAGAERLVREMTAEAFDEPRIALDLTDVHSLDDVARRMLLEVVRRLSLEDRTVYLIDPTAVIPDPDPGDGGQVTVVESVADLIGRQPAR